MKKHKVLIAKEHLVYCHELSDYLGQMTIFDIMPFAHDGYETIQRIAVEKPDVLLLDAVLPKLDGVGVLKKLNAMGLSEGIRIIVMSPFNDDKLVDQLQELGALYVMHLPAVPEVVFSRIVDFAIDDEVSRRAGEDNKEEQRRERLTELLRHNPPALIFTDGNKPDELTLELAEYFDLPEQDIKNALSYWTERKGIDFTKE